MGTKLDTSMCGCNLAEPRETAQIKVVVLMTSESDSTRWMPRVKEVARTSRIRSDKWLSAGVEVLG